MTWQRVQQRCRCLEVRKRALAELFLRPVAPVRSDVAVVPLHADDVTPRSVFVATSEGVSDRPAVTAFIEILKARP